MSPCTIFFQERLARDSKVWTVNLLLRERRHYQTSTMCRYFIFSSTEFDRRYLVQRPIRHWGCTNVPDTTTNVDPPTTSQTLDQGT